MKSKLITISLVLFLAVALLAPTVGLAFDWGTDLHINQLSGGNTPFGSRNLIGVIGLVINLAFGVAAIVAVVYLIIGGFSYVTAGGNPEAIEAAKTTIINSIIGLLIILASYLIIDFILDQLQVVNIGL